MRLLLDTHIWLWRLLDPDRVSPSLDALLRDPDTRVHLSPISVWETLVLVRTGRLTLNPDPAAWIDKALQRTPTTMLPLTHAIAIRSEQLDGLVSNDPADRFLVATALVHELTLATADAVLIAYARWPTAS